MNENYLKIINHYGITNQQRKFNEEVFEVQEAITKYEENALHYFGGIDKELEEHIAEEIADCRVLLKQFQEYYGIKDSEIESIMAMKVTRTLERMEKNDSNE